MMKPSTGNDLAISPSLSETEPSMEELKSKVSELMSEKALLEEQLRMREEVMQNLFSFIADKKQD